MCVCVAELDGSVAVLGDSFSSPLSPLLRLTDIATAVDADWTRLARTLAVTECDISHIRSTFADVTQQARSQWRRQGEGGGSFPPMGGRPKIM